MSGAARPRRPAHERTGDPLRDPFKGLTALTPKTTSEAELGALSQVIAEAAEITIGHAFSERYRAMHALGGSGDEIADALDNLAAALVASTMDGLRRTHAEAGL
jgi:hypothetical protein